MVLTNDDKKDLYFANAVLGAIENIETPMLMYDGEKRVVEKALRLFVEKMQEKEYFSL